MTDQAQHQSPLEKLSIKHFSGRTIPVSYFRTVSDVAEEIVKANPNRVSLILQNVGSSDVAISLFPAISFNNGLKLSAGGGAVSIDFQNDGESVGFEIYGICSPGHVSNLRIYAVVVI